MPLLSCSWATSSVRAPWSGSGKRCRAEWSLPVAFDEVLREAIFPVGLTRCGADVWVLIKAWGIRFCRAMGSTVNCAAAEKLKLESRQLLSGWLYNAGRQLGQGSKRSQVVRHQELRQKKHIPIQNISYGLYFCKRCQKWGAKTALHGNLIFCRSQNPGCSFLGFFSTLCSGWGVLQQEHWQYVLTVERTNEN